MGNIIVLLVIITIIASASYKIYAEKKKGAKCVGCPYAVESSKSKCGCN